jgi:RHS repeat-associated protein
MLTSMVSIIVALMIMIGGNPVNINRQAVVPDPTAANPTDFERERNILLDHLDNITRIDETQNGETTQITTEIPLDSDYSKLNQYLRFDNWGLEYDKNGNLTQKGTQKMYHDYRNRMVRSTEGTTSTTENKYDALGRRLQKLVTTDSQTKTENYYYAGHQLVEVRDSSDQVKRQFIYGNGIDEVIMMDVYNGSIITPYYFHTNAIGSTTAVTDANGQVVERYKYGLFGMPTFMDAAGNVIPKSDIGNNILFQGREYEPETNFYYFRARHLDPIMGRFLQTDPMGYQDSLNLYQAFNMNPVNFVDPFGLYKFEPSERERDEDKGAIRAWGMENIGWDYFVMQTGHDLWNVASLGTLGRVENQENLGTWGGVFESSGNAVTRLSNTLTLGLQDEIYYTQMKEGAGLKNIVKGTGKGLLNLTPYEEIKTVFSSDSDVGQKISSIFMGISKLASLVGLYETIKTPSNPKAQSLEDFQARKWYWKNEKLIHENIDQSLPIKSKGLEAFEERNLIRTKARELMADQKKAAELNRTNPNKTLKQAVRENYKEGYVGDELWRRIYNSAIKSRPIVDFKMRLEIIRHYLFFSGVLAQ